MPDADAAPPEDCGQIVLTITDARRLLKLLTACAAA
jgi:hypothetical protein